MTRCPKWPGLTVPTSSSPARTSGPWTPVWTWWQRVSLSTACAFRRWMYTMKGPTPARSRPSSSPRPPRFTSSYKVSSDHGQGIWDWQPVSSLTARRHLASHYCGLSTLKPTTSGKDSPYRHQGLCLPTCQTGRDLNMSVRRMRMSGKVYGQGHGVIWSRSSAFIFFLLYYALYKQDQCQSSGVICDNVQISIIKDDWRIKSVALETIQQIFIICLGNLHSSICLFHCSVL